MNEILKYISSAFFLMPSFEIMLSFEQLINTDTTDSTKFNIYLEIENEEENI